MSSSSFTSLHITALDAIVNVNSLFTLAVFVGFREFIALVNVVQIASTAVVHYPTAVEFIAARINRSALRAGMFVSGASSVVGCTFLMLALVNVVQIKLGTLACGISHDYAAIVPLVILVAIALLIYVSIVVYAFTR